jgi:hypothetical protein
MSYEVLSPQPKVNWCYEDEAVAAAKKLESLGFVDWEVVVAKNDTLQIDYDNMSEGKLHPKFNATLGLLTQRFDKNNLGYTVHRSKSGTGNHVIVNLPGTMDEVERVAWQAAFGSDGIREALNLPRIKRNIKNPILLFMKKDRDITIKAYEDKPGRKFRDE